MDEKIENAGILKICVIHVLELMLQLTEERWRKCTCGVVASWLSLPAGKA